MNTSLQSIIDDALYSEHVEETYPVYGAEHTEYETAHLDDDTVKLAHALDFLSGNLDNIGTAQEKIAELHTLQEKLAAELNWDWSKGQSTGPGGGEVGSNRPITTSNPSATTTTPNPTTTTKPSPSTTTTTPNPTTTTTTTTPDPTKQKVKMTKGRLQKFKDAAVNRGKASAGFGDAIKNTWKKGAGGKAALIGGGALAAGLVGNAMFGGQSKTGSLKLASRMGLDEDQFYVMEKAAQLRGVSTHSYLLQRAAQMNEDSILGAGLRNR